MDNKHLEPHFSGHAQVQSEQSSDFAQMVSLYESADFQKAFSKQPNISERIKFVLSHEAVRLAIEKMVPPSISVGGDKSDTRAASQGQIGMKAFEGKLYETALSAYSNAIRFVTQTGGLLPIALGNRSGAFFQVKQYESALKDIEAAQSHKKYKPFFMLTIRQCQCLVRLGRVAQAREILNTIKPAELDKNNTALLNKFYEREGKNLKNVKVEEGEPKKEEIKPELLKNISSVIKILSEKGRFEPNANISSLSSKVEVRYDEKNGRHLVTTQNVRFGDILAVTKPYASVLTEEQELFYCHHCMTSLKITTNHYPYTVPCTECARVLYCSEHCRAESWQSYHRFECQLLSHPFKQAFADNKSGSLYLALRTWFVAGGLDSIRAVTQKYPTDGGDPAKSAYFTDDQVEYYENVYRMAIEESGSIEEDIKLITNAAFLFKWSKLDQIDDADRLEAAELPHIETSENDIFAISTLLRHYLQCLSNFSLFVRSDLADDVDATKAESFSTLDPLISLVPKSCDPNISIIVVDCVKSTAHVSNVCVFFALKPIAAGTVLSTAGEHYGDSAKYRIYLEHFVQCRQEHWNKMEPKHVCRCKHCEVKRCVNPFGFSTTENDQELIFCGANCNGFIRQTDDGRVNCFTCKRVIGPDELIEMKRILKEIYKPHSKAMVLITRIKSLMEQNKQKANLPPPFMNLLSRLETLINDELVPLAVKYSRVMLLDMYKHLNYFYRYYSLVEPKNKFHNLYKAWAYADFSHGTLEGHFGGASLGLLMLLQENVRFFSEAINEVRLEMMKPIGPVAGPSKKMSRLNLNRNRQQEDETRKMQVHLIKNFENAQKRLRFLYERYEMI